jgi:hypothetical protein
MRQAGFALKFSVVRSCVAIKLWRGLFRTRPANDPTHNDDDHRYIGDIRSLADPKRENDAGQPGRSNTSPFPTAELVPPCSTCPAPSTHTSTRHTCGADGKRRLSAQTPQPEMFTMKESLAFCRCCRLHHGRDQAGRTTLRKINAGKRLIDLKWPPLASRRIDRVPVVQAKRHIAVLLNFECYDVAAQSVNRPSRYEDAIAGLRTEPYEVVRHRLISDCPPQVVCSSAWLQTRINAAFWRCLYHHPSLGLPGFVRLQQAPIRVRGMHLD